MTILEQLEYLKKLGHKAYIKNGRLYSSNGSLILTSLNGETGIPKFSTVVSSGKRVFFTNNGKFNRTGYHTVPDNRSFLDKGAEWIHNNIGSPIHEAISAYLGEPRSVMESEKSILDKVEDATIAFAKPYGRLAKQIAKPIIKTLAYASFNDPEVYRALSMAGFTPTFSTLSEKEKENIAENIGEQGGNFILETTPYVIPGMNYAYMAAQGDKDRKDENYLGMVLNWTPVGGKILKTAGKAALSTNTGKAAATSAVMNYNVATTNLPLFLNFEKPTSSLITNMAKAKHLIKDGTKEIPAWFGKLHSISEVVNPDGTVNPQKLREIQREVASHYGVPEILFRLENPVWHKTDPNTWIHTRQVAQNAWQLPTPEGFTKQDQMFAELGEELSKKLLTYLRTRKYIKSNELNLTQAKQLAENNGLDISELID